MSPEERVQQFILTGSLKLDKNNNPAGTLVPMISVSVRQISTKKGTTFPDIPARTDRDGDPLVRLFPRPQIKEMELLGWRVYKIAAPPKGLAKSVVANDEWNNPAPVKKGRFGRPVKEEKINNDVDSQE